MKTARPPRKVTFAVLMLAVLCGDSLWRPPSGAATEGWSQDRGNAWRSGARVWRGREPRGEVAWRVDVAPGPTRDEAAPMVDASPIVADTGSIYVGTIGGRLLFPVRRQSLVAFNPDGSRQWAISLDAEGHHYNVRAAPAWRSFDQSIIVVGFRKEARSDGSWGIKGRVFLVSAAGVVLQISGDIEGLGLASPLMVGGKVAYIFSHPVFSDDVLWRFDSAFAVSAFNAVHYDVVNDYFCVFFCYNTLFVENMYSDGIDPDVRPLLPATSLDPVNAELVQPSRQTARLRLADGHKLWQKPFSAFGTAAVAGGVSYIPAGGSVEALDRDGDFVSRFVLEGYARAVAKGNQQFYVSAKGSFNTTGSFLHAFTTDGTLQWTQPIGNGSAGAPVVAILSHGEELIMVAVTQEGAVGNQHGVYAFRKDGTIAWFVPLDGPALGSPAISDRAIYVATQRSLYAIR